MSDTCASCQFIGVSYWGHHSDYGGLTHHCLKEKERRAETMKPTGDFAEDFMRNFRAFFDAKGHNKACRHYQLRSPIEGDKAVLLKMLAANGGKGAFGFFSKENALCTDMNGMFVEEDEWARSQRKPSDGTRDWMLTEVGKVEVARLPAIEEAV